MNGLILRNLWSMFLQLIEYINCVNNIRCDDFIWKKDKIVGHHRNGFFLYKTWKLEKMDSGLAQLDA